MTLKDTFTILDINLDKKDLLYDKKPKRLEYYWNSDCAKHPSKKHCKIFCD